MIEELHVRDLALIEEVWLEPGPGLTVLTGETGAGKTVLVGALKLLLGERADATMVRGGAEEAVVEGRIVVDGVEHTVRRRVSADGRSRCYLDGEMTTVGGLADALGPLVDLHGQHDHQALLSSATHAGYLDRSIGKPAADAMAAYRDAYREHAAASAELESLEEALRDRDQRVDYLAFQVAEIDAVAPKAGEDEAISERLPLLRHGERLTAASAEAYRLLRDDGGGSDAIAAALAALHGASGLDPALDAIAERLSEAASAVEEAGALVRDYGEGVEHDPEALNAAEARLAALATLKKKYGPSLDEVIAARDAAAAHLEVVESGDEALAAVRRSLEESERALCEKAESLAAIRKEAAPSFSARMREAASDLALPKAVFEVAVTDLPREAWTADGPVRVEFLFAADGAEQPRPLSRIASGGEVSRVMLALKGVLGEADPVPVLVFDEVDAGIGGATALAVGRRLAALASARQVLVVTHLAQVAAFARRQLVVEKADAGGRSVTRVRAVDGEERVAEIARMLSGGAGETALAHARELLGSAAPV